MRAHTHLVHRLDVLRAAADGERRACGRAAARRLTPGTDVASSTLAHCGQRLMPGGSSMLSVDGTVGAPDPSSTTIGSGGAPLIAAISRTVYNKSTEEEAVSWETFCFDQTSIMLEALKYMYVIVMAWLIKTVFKFRLYCACAVQYSQ